MKETSFRKFRIKTEKILKFIVESNKIFHREGMLQILLLSILRDWTQLSVKNMFEIIKILKNSFFMQLYEIIYKIFLIFL